jgi:hypothetical protein
MQQQVTLDQEIAAILEEANGVPCQQHCIHVVAQRYGLDWRCIVWDDGRSSIYYVHRGVLIQIGFLVTGAYEAWWTCS